MRVPSAIRGVLRQEVQPQRCQRLIRSPAVHPQQLKFPDADEIGIAPQFREEEASKTKYATISYSNRFVERVRAMAEASTAQ